MNRAVLRRPVIAIAMSLFSTLAMAGTFFVSPAGNDGNPGSQESPFQSIPKAIQSAQPGDSILIMAGVYPPGFTLGKSGTPDKPITLKAAGNGDVIIRGDCEKKTGWTPLEGKPGIYETVETNSVQSVLIDLDTSPLVIDSLERVNSPDEMTKAGYRYFHDRANGKLLIRYDGKNPETDHTIHLFRAGAGMGVSGSHLVIEGLVVSHCGQNGISLGNAKQTIIRNCKVSLCGASWGGGIGLDNAEGCRLQNNIIYRCMNGIMLSQSKQTDIDHTTIYRTRAHGIITYNTADTLIRNNIVFAGGRSGSALYVGKDADKGLKLDYNCYLDYGTSQLIYWHTGTKYFPTFWDYRAVIKNQDEHSISDDPLFVSIAQYAEDFTLKTDSPCIGKAENGCDMGAQFKTKPVKKQ